MVRYFGDDLLGSASCSSSFVGVHALSAGRPGNPGSDGASPYRLNRRSILRAILLVVVVVLVLDSFWGLNRNPGDARRPVRTEPLPTALSDALCLGAISGRSHRPRRQPGQRRRQLGQKGSSAKTLCLSFGTSGPALRHRELERTRAKDFYEINAISISRYDTVCCRYEGGDHGAASGVS
jgi:hypothetical protein